MITMEFASGRPVNKTPRLENQKRSNKMVDGAHDDEI